MIYFIEHAGQIKIGYSSNVEKRLTALKTAIPDLTVIATMEGSLGHERTIHDCLAVHRKNGEWFEDCSAVRTFIAAALADGVREWKAKRKADYSPSMWDARAKRLAEIICADRAKSDFAVIENELSIPAGTLWRIRYRQDREVSVGEYFGLLVAAREAVKRRAAELDRACAFISDLEHEDAENVNATVDMDRKFAAYQAAQESFSAVEG